MKLEKRLSELLEKQMLTLEELEEIEEHEQIVSVEDCGMSGRYIGKHWYSVTTASQEEYDIYTD